MQWATVHCLLLALIWPVTSARDLEHSLDNFKRVLSAKLLGPGVLPPTVIQKPVLRAPQILPNVLPPQHLHPALGIIQTYLGTQTKNQTKTAIQGANNLVTSGIITGYQPIVLDDGIQPLPLSPLRFPPPPSAIPCPNKHVIPIIPAPRPAVNIVQMAPRLPPLRHVLASRVIKLSRPIIPCPHDKRPVIEAIPPPQPIVPCSHNITGFIHTVPQPILEDIPEGPRLPPLVNIPVAPIIEVAPPPQPIVPCSHNITEFIHTVPQPILEDIPEGPRLPPLVNIPVAPVIEVAPPPPPQLIVPYPQSIIHHEAIVPQPILEAIPEPPRLPPLVHYPILPPVAPIVELPPPPPPAVPCPHKVVEFAPAPVLPRIAPIVEWTPPPPPHKSCSHDKIAALPPQPFVEYPARPVFDFIPEGPKLPPMVGLPVKPAFAPMPELLPPPPPFIPNPYLNAAFVERVPQPPSPSIEIPVVPPVAPVVVDTFRDVITVDDSKPPPAFFNAVEVNPQRFYGTPVFNKFNDEVTVTVDQPSAPLTIPPYTKNGFSYNQINGDGSVTTYNGYGDVDVKYDSEPHLSTFRYGYNSPRPNHYVPDYSNYPVQQHQYHPNGGFTHNVPHHPNAINEQLYQHRPQFNNYHNYQQGIPHNNHIPTSFNHHPGGYSFKLTNGEGTVTSFHDSDGTSSQSHFENQEKNNSLVDGKYYQKFVPGVVPSFNANPIPLVGAPYSPLHSHPYFTYTYKNLGSGETYNPYILNSNSNSDSKPAKSNEYSNKNVDQEVATDKIANVNLGPFAEAVGGNNVLTKIVKIDTGAQTVEINKVNIPIAFKEKENGVDLIFKKEPNQLFTNGNIKQSVTSTKLPDIPVTTDTNDVNAVPSGAYKFSYGISSDTKVEPSIDTNPIVVAEDDKPSYVYTQSLDNGSKMDFRSDNKQQVLVEKIDSNERREMRGDVPDIA